ncbi:unnamed protein product [Brachionus calyciflorus]|uniref:RNA-directed DNA polymerase n=1 Tax=Brachionus calyciflorus TaxID=104777 RepID=A0A814ITY1_9BILA|nr:unnamed protein product [Brachionus calyciflorus]
MKRDIGNNLVYDSESGTFDEFEAAFKYDGLPGLDEENRTRMLRSRLLSAVPETIKNYLELLSDKKWTEIVAIFDKSVDYKEIYQGNFQIKEEVDLNKIDQSRNRSDRFNGTCNYCQKFGHKAIDCRSRKKQLLAQNSHQNFQKKSSNQWRNNSNQQSSQSFQSNKNNFNRTTNQREKQQGYVIDAEIEVDSDETQEANSIECQNIIGYDKSKLVRIESKVELFGQKVNMKFLADSGSSASFISPDSLPINIAEKINRFMKTGNQAKGMMLRKTNLTIKSALNTEEVKCAVGLVKTKMNGWEGEHEFLFAKLSEPAILGIDFFKKFEANFDFTDMEIVIKDNNQKHKINMVNSSETIESFKVRLDEKIRIKANSENLIKITAECFNANDCVMFEPNALTVKDLSNGIVLASSLNTVQEDKSVFLSVMNTTSKDVYISKNSLVGSLCYAEEAISSTEETAEENLPKEDIKMDVRKIKIGDSLDTTQRNELFLLLEKYKHVFQWSEFGMDRTNLTEHRINTGNAAPIKQRPYRLPQAAQDEVERQVDEMTRNQVIEESKSPWASPIVLVKKKRQEGKEQEYRFCIDFRRLNEVTIKDSYPLPRIDDTVDAFGGSYVFSTMDCAGGFLQVPLAEEDKEKTSFIANHNLYQFKVMPFGLCNAPSTFQRLMDTLLRNLTWKYCLVYLDDVIVYSKDFKSHMDRLELILSKFEKAGLKLKPSKCCFVMNQVNYLGYVISGDGLLPDAAKTKSIANMGTPKSKEELKRFLGMLSYYRRFIPNFSTTAACLFELTKDKIVFSWSKEADVAFKTLKDQLLKSPLLIYPNFKNGFAIYTDASGVGIGAVLTQVIDGKIHPVAYASRQLSACERNYSTSEREMLAIVWAAKHFQSYIYGRHVKFFTDHKPLSTLVKSKQPNGRLYKLLLKLQDLDYTIIYCPGKQNTLADLLSRLNAESETQAKVATLDVNLNIEWDYEQDNDRDFALVKMAVRSKDQNILQDSENSRFWCQNLNSLCIENDILKFKTKDENLVTIVPKGLRSKICSIYHDSISSGHLSFEKTFRSVASRAVGRYTGNLTILFLKEDLINIFGVPLAWLTDQGRNFESEVFSQFCRNYSIKKLRTTGYHPQCNGLVERTIKTIKQMLSTFVNQQHDNWDEVLSDVVFAYNKNIHSSTGFAPNEIVFKKILPSSQDRRLEIETPEIKVDENQLVKEVNNNLNKAQQAQKEQFDKKASNKMTFNVGDFVLLKNSRLRVGQVKSFEPKFNGPYVIKKVISDFNFEILNPQDDKTLVVHYDRLIKYNMRKTPNEVINFNQELLQDSWHENRMRLALFINRKKNSTTQQVSDQEQILNNEPIISNANELANTSTINQELDRSVILDDTNFFDSEQTVLEDPENQMIFNRLENSQSEDESDSEVEKDAQENHSSINQAGSNWVMCNICNKQFKGQRGLKSHMTKSVRKHEEIQKKNQNQLYA